MLVDLWGDIVSEDVPSTKSLGNVHALLPSLELRAVQLLELTELLHFLIFFVEVVEIDIAQVVESTDELAPGSLPFIVPGLPSGSS